VRASAPRAGAGGTARCPAREWFKARCSLCRAHLRARATALRGDIHRSETRPDGELTLWPTSCAGCPRSRLDWRALGRRARRPRRRLHARLPRYRHRLPSRPPASWRSVSAAPESRPARDRRFIQIEPKVCSSVVGSAKAARDFGTAGGRRRAVMRRFRCPSATRRPCRTSTPASAPERHGGPRGPARRHDLGTTPAFDHELTFDAWFRSTTHSGVL